MRNAERLCIFCTLLFFNYSYLTEDYSHMVEAIVDWGAGSRFWNSLQLIEGQFSYDKSAWHTFFNSINVSLYYTMEAAVFVCFSAILSRKSEGFYKGAWCWLARFFGLRLFMEMYAAIFGLSINEKIFTALLFFVTLCIVVVLYLYHKRKATDNKPKLTSDEL